MVLFVRCLPSTVAQPIRIFVIVFFLVPQLNLVHVSVLLYCVPRCCTVT